MEAHDEEERVSVLQPPKQKNHEQAQPKADKVRKSLDSTKPAKRRSKSKDKDEILKQKDQ